MRNLQYAELHRAACQLSGETLAIGSQGLVGAVASFEKNIGIILRLSRMPETMMHFGQLAKEADGVARQNLQERGIPRTADAVWKEMTAPTVPLSTVTSLYWDEQGRPWAPTPINLGHLDNFLADKGTNDARGQIQGLYRSIIVLGWTAFEAMAGDLWVSALNTCPAELAQLTGTPNRVSKMASARLTPAQSGLQGKSKTVDLNDIQRLTRGSYDLSSRMGDLLKDRFKFIALKGIREAYSSAFSEREKASTHARFG